MSSNHYRILIVDDVVDNALLLQTFLESEGHTVDIADSAALALEKMSASPFNLILLDVMMPKMNGYELTRAIRQNEQLRSVRVILVTAHIDVCRIKGLAAGANDFVRKPIDFEELNTKIESLLQYTRGTKGRGKARGRSAAFDQE
jgi:CheY-like chemotaxis protein